MPFGEFKDFADCVAKNQDKDSPEGYCAAVHKKITGKWPSEATNEMKIEASFMLNEKAEKVKVGHWKELKDNPEIFNKDDVDLSIKIGGQPVPKYPYIIESDGYVYMFSSKEKSGMSEGMMGAMMDQLEDYCWKVYKKSYEDFTPDRQREILDEFRESQAGERMTKEKSSFQLINKKTKEMIKEGFSTKQEALEYKFKNYTGPASDSVEVVEISTKSELSNVKKSRLTEVAERLEKSISKKCPKCKSTNFHVNANAPDYTCDDCGYEWNESQATKETSSQNKLQEETIYATVEGIWPVCPKCGTQFNPPDDVKKSGIGAVCPKCGWQLTPKESEKSTKEDNYTCPKCGYTGSGWIEKPLYRICPNCKEWVYGKKKEEKSTRTERDAKTNETVSREKAVRAYCSKCDKVYDLKEGEKNCPIHGIEIATKEKVVSIDDTARELYGKSYSELTGEQKDKVTEYHRNVLLSMEESTKETSSQNKLQEETKSYKGTNIQIVEYVDTDAKEHYWVWVINDRMSDDGFDSNTEALIDAKNWIDLNLG